MKWTIQWTVLVVGATILLLAPRAHADSGQPERLVVGAQAGLTLATFTGPGANNEFVSSSRALGFAAGAMVAVRLHELFAARAEVLFARKGASATANGTKFGTYAADYIEVPLLATVTLPLSGRIRYYGAGGVSLAYRLAVKVVRPDGTTLDLTDRFEAMDMGWVVAAGVAMAARGAVTAEVRYSAGLSNIDKTGAEVDEVNNRALYFMLGYQW